MLKQRFTLSEGERSSFDSLQVCLNKKFIHRYTRLRVILFLILNIFENTCLCERSKFKFLPQVSNRMKF